jgi:hypothetical protein
MALYLVVSLAESIRGVCGRSSGSKLLVAAGLQGSIEQGGDLDSKGNSGFNVRLSAASLALLTIEETRSRMLLNSTTSAITIDREAHPWRG